MSDETQHWQKSEAELQAAYAAQIRMLNSSCEAYDRGDLWEAARIANHVHQLLFDPPPGRRRRTKSIVTQLFPTRSISMRSSRLDWDETNLLTLSGLVHKRGTYNPTTGVFDACHAPHLDWKKAEYYWLPIGDWWAEPIVRDGNDVFASRWTFIVSMRDQDGGSHTDGELTDQAYVGVAKRNSTGWAAIKPSGVIENMADEHLAIVRQIGWEVLESLPEPKSTG